jgi:hypothetical protein
VVVIADTKKIPPFPVATEQAGVAICVSCTSRWSTISYRIGKKVRRFLSTHRLSRAGRRRLLRLVRGRLLLSSLNLEKGIVNHDAVRYPVAGAWTVAIVRFRFVTPRPRPSAPRYRQLDRPAWVRACKYSAVWGPRVPGPLHRPAPSAVLCLSHFRAAGIA